MPEARGACPGAAELAALHEGELEGPPALRVAQHVEACELCRAELAELALDRRFASELRELLPGGSLDSGAAHAGEPTPDPEYEALVALLRESAGGERYEVLGELGRGGMGVVYEVHDRVLRRNLAMKVARAGRSASSPASPGGRRLARFLEEVRITGQLHHPSIIPVHELGVDAEGRAFFTMRKVRGKELREVLEDYESGAGGWNLRRLVALILHACDAVAYAHSKQVVHRDLKPSNIMVERFDAVYVMDWGVAKVLIEEGGDANASTASGFPAETKLWPRGQAPGGDDDPDSPLLTLHGEVLGTPAYMAPEQALGRVDEVDLRADVYSMGAIYYRLLSGRSPYDDVEPATPRAAWVRLVKGPPTPLTEIAPEAPPELVAVCERAMARDPAQRYADMAGLTADLRAWLEGRVVRAHRTGVVAELRKWIGRNRVPAGAALLALALLFGGLMRFSVVEARFRDKVARGASTLAAYGLLERAPAQALQQAIQVAQAEQTYPSRTMVLSALSRQARNASLHRAGVLSTVWCMEGLRRAWSPSGDSFAAGFRPLADGPMEIRVWNVSARRFEPLAFEGPATEVYAFHPGGRKIASAGPDGAVALHDLETGKSTYMTAGDGRAHADRVVSLAFDPRGELLASASWDGSVRLWNVATEELAHALTGHAGTVTSIDFDAAGRRLLSASGPPQSGYASDHTARVWDVQDGRCLLEFEGHADSVTSARFHPGGDLVLSTSYDHTAQLWDPRNGEVRDAVSLEGPVWDGAFSPDGSTMALAFDAGFLVRDVDAGREQRVDRYAAHDGRAVTDIEFAPSGDRILTVGGDHVGRVWELDVDLRPRLALELRDADMRYGAWSPDGAAIATSSGGSTCLWFPDGAPTTDWKRPAERPATQARFHPAGDRVLLTFEDSPAFEYAFVPGEGLQSAPRTLGDAPARDVATTADGTWVLVAQDNGRLGLWRSDQGGPMYAAGFLELDVESLHPARARDLFGVILTDGGAAVVDCSGQPEVTARFLEGAPFHAIQLSADGRRVALGTVAGCVLAFDLAANRSALVNEQLDLESPSQTTVYDVSFLGAGRHLASAGPETGLKIWNADTGIAVGLRGLGGGRTVGRLLSIREGRQLLAREQWGSSVSLTELASGARTYLRASPDSGSHRNRITAWALDGEQRRLLTTSLDHTATVWDLERAEPWITFAGHDLPVLAGDLSPDGEWAVTADSGGRVCVWPTDPLPWALRAQPIETRPKPR